NPRLPHALPRLGHDRKTRPRIRLATTAHWLAISVLGMSRRRVDQPDRPGLVVNEVSNSTSAGYLIFPLLKIFSIMTVRRQTAAQAVLPVVVSSRTGVRSEEF